MSYLIELNQITKKYQRGPVTTEVLHGVSLKVQKKDLLAIIGTSGSGKSTLMNIMGLLDRPSTGEYWFEGKNINHYSVADLAFLRNHRIGFIFQAFFLLPYLKVIDNVGLPLTYQELPEDEIRERSHRSLQRVGVDHLADRRPNEISGGQAQRVAIARALVTNPSILLADEPTGALDSKTGYEILNLFTQLNNEDENTIIIITHNPEIAEHCPRIIEIADGLIVEGGNE